MVSSTPLNPSQVGSVPSGSLRPGDSEGDGGHAVDGAFGSPYEKLLNEGFQRLSFPAAMEAEFIEGIAERRKAQLRFSAVFAMVLNLGMLLSDWLMVPDQFDLALRVRLLIQMPVLIIYMLMLPRVSVRLAEWLSAAVSVLAGFILLMVCVRSQDALAPAYLVGLSMIILFNGGAVRTRFWMGLVSDLIVLVLFFIGMLAMPQAPMALQVAMTLVLVVTALFKLYSCHALEHDERVNWLMLRHEQMLSRALELGNKRLDELSGHDALTGLANRRRIDEHLQQVWDRARQAGDELALLMMDIDHFKRFNDHYGHLEGDACLKVVAATIGAHLRMPGDQLGRFGGEEFIAVLNKTGLQAALAAGERVRDGVQGLQRAHDRAPLGYVTLSVGVACVSPQANEASPARLVALADRALYLAKHGGRNRVCAPPPEA
jgi:diguanylate cyclase (GGDEF)-like protein